MLEAVLRTNEKGRGTRITYFRSASTLVVVGVIWVVDPRCHHSHRLLLCAVSNRDPVERSKVCFLFCPMGYGSRSRAICTFHKVQKCRDSLIHFRERKGGIYGHILQHNVTSSWLALFHPMVMGCFCKRCFGRCFLLSILTCGKSLCIICRSLLGNLIVSDSILLKLFLTAA